MKKSIEVLVINVFVSCIDCNDSCFNQLLPCHHTQSLTSFNVIRKINLHFNEFVLYLKNYLWIVDIIVFTEVDILEELIFYFKIKNFKLYHKSKKHSRGGVVWVYVRNVILSTHI